MAMTETSTVRSETTEQTIWRIAVCEYERELAAFKPVDAAYNEASKGYDRKDADAVASYDAVEKGWEAALQKMWDARERMFLTPAPDADALRYKLDTLLPYLREAQIDDLERIETLDADIRRILGRVA